MWLAKKIEEKYYPENKLKMDIEIITEGKYSLEILQDKMILQLRIKKPPLYKSIKLQDMSIDLQGIVEGRISLQEIKEHLGQVVTINFYASKDQKERLANLSNNFKDDIKVNGLANFNCNNREISYPINLEVRASHYQ
jgi:hypothetical protein